jgi:hypothetical protein
MPRSNSYNLPVCTTVSSDPIGGLSDSVPGYTATLMRRAIARPLQRLADVLNGAGTSNAGPQDR